MCGCEGERAWRGLLSRQHTAAIVHDSNKFNKTVEYDGKRRLELHTYT